MQQFTVRYLKHLGNDKELPEFTVNGRTIKLIGIGKDLSYIVMDKQNSKVYWIRCIKHGEGLAYELLNDYATISMSYIKYFADDRIVNAKYLFNELKVISGI